jgi:hypothetical protein
MRKLIEKFFWIGAFILTLPSAWGFSLSGNIGNNDDAWQVITIGYGWNDPVAPKDIYEEYRPVVPVQYYASDASFITYFGSSGLTNIDAAFGLLNGVMCGLTNTPVFLFSSTNGITLNTSGVGGGTALTLGANNSLDNYSSSLSEFPQVSEQWNYTAQTLGLLDMKSYVLKNMVLELGLADPDRYVWTLHDRLPNPLGLPNPKCPQDVQYLVVQRNFDLTQASPYSPYINGALYTFYIRENCGLNPAVPWSAITEPEPVDTFGNAFTAVTAGGLRNGNANGNGNGNGTSSALGGFYTGLTSDDVAGLKYLLSTNNLNWENTAPSGGVLLLTNVQPTQTLTTIPYSLLLSASTTTSNSPAVLQAAFPGLTFVSVVTNVVSQITPTVTAYFTNLPGPYTNSVPFVNNGAVYPTNWIVPFTNWSPVQFGGYPNYPIPLTTLPLGPLLTLAPYTDPVTLAGLYPGLLIGAVKTNSLQVQIVTNIAPYYTNQSVTPVFSNTVAGGFPNVYSLTNIYYFTNQPGPTVIDYDQTSYSIISTMDLATFSDAASTNSPAVMQALYPGLQILRAYANPGWGYATNYVSFLTNKVGSPYGTFVAVTVPVSTNAFWTTNYNYIFGNIFTNHYFTNRYITIQSIWITNLIGAPYGSPTVAYTNQLTVNTNMISGDFFLIPTNWCGFDLLETLPPNTPPYSYSATNTVIYNGFNTNGSTGTNYTAGGNTYGLIKNYYTVYTNHQYAVRPGICEAVMTEGTSYATNIVTSYNYDFLNIITNHYFTNTYVTVASTNVYACPGGSPDLLCTNIQPPVSFYTNLVSGDFYIVPQTWCGFQIIGLLTNVIGTTTFTVASNTTGTGNIGQQYTSVVTTYNTNYTYSIRPGFCEPALAFGTNYATNVVTQYTYYFGNIQTNNAFATNSPVTVITTNLMIWTNAIVGTLTNIITTNIVYDGVSGDFFIVPAGFCEYNILGTLTTNVAVTTTVVTSTNAPGVQDLGQRYTQTSYSLITNDTLLVQPVICSQAAPVAALRRGIGRVQFIRANYDSLVGQFFQPLTNTYSMVTVTNGQQVMEYYQRVVTQPDILFQAQDLTVPTGANPYGVDYTITTPRFDQSAITTALAGPGTIVPGVTMVFNKNANDLYLNGSLATAGLSTNAFLNQYTMTQLAPWGAFDASTNYPVVYPSTVNISNLMNQMVIQVTPTTLPDGTNGVAYNGGAGVTLTAAGGQPPYVWAAPGLSSLVPGMGFNTTTATLSGTPSASGAFTFTVQLTDSANRVVSLNYSITIH